MFWRWFSESDSFVRIPLPVKGALFASPMPYGPYDKWNTVIRFYDKNRIDAAVVLVTDEEIRQKCKKRLLDVYAKRGIDAIHFPIADLTSPSVGGVRELVDQLVLRLASERIVVHCNAGVGRTGVIIGCVVQHVSGGSGEDALAFVKEHLRINMTDEQCRFVKRYAAGIQAPTA